MADLAKLVELYEKLAASPLGMAHRQSQATGGTVMKKVTTEDLDEAQFGRRLHNRPPDVTVNLTHDQATFMLKNCLANTGLCLALVMSLADEKISIEEKQAKAAPILAMQEKFRDVMSALRAAGARDPDDDE